MTDISVTIGSRQPVNITFPNVLLGSNSSIVATTDDLLEGSLNFYYTDDRVNTYILGSLIANGSTSGSAIWNGSYLSTQFDAKADTVHTHVVADITDIDLSNVVTGSDGGVTDGNVVFFNGSTGFLIKDNGITLSGSNTGDQDLSSLVVGPSVVVDNTLARFDLTTGKLIQGGSIIENDAGLISNVDGIQLKLSPSSASAEGLLMWNATDGTAQIGLPGGNVNLQIGQETLLRVTNKTGSDILNGAVVYVNGAQGNRPTISLADADSVTSHYTIGLATETITDNNSGYICVYGLVRDVNTSGFSEGDTLYISQIAGSITNTEPAYPAHGVQIGHCILSDSSAGVILVRIGQHGHLNEQEQAARLSIDTVRQGFVNTTNSTIAFDGTNTFTISDTGSGWSYWRQGYKYEITGSKTIVLPGTPVESGTYYIYIDATDGTLSQANSSWNLLDSKVPVATITFNDTLTPKYWLSDERHTALIDYRMQYYLHSVDGTKAVSFPTVSGYTLSSDVNANKTIAITASTILDQDLKHDLASFAKSSGSTADYAIFYRSAGSWLWSYSTMPFSYTGAYINYDNAGTLTEGTSSKYYNSYLILTNKTGAARYTFVPGRGEFTSLASAQAESVEAFDWTGLPIAESVIAYRFTWVTNASYTSSGKCVLAATPQKINIAAVTNTSSGAGTDHNTLTHLQGGTTNEFYHLTSAQHTAITSGSIDAGSIFTGTISDSRLPTSQTGKTFTSNISGTNGSFTGSLVISDIYSTGTNGSIFTKTGNTLAFSRNSVSYISASNPSGQLAFTTGADTFDKTRLIMNSSGSITYGGSYSPTEQHEFYGKIKCNNTIYGLTGSFTDSLVAGSIFSAGNINFNGSILGYGGALTGLPSGVSDHGALTGLEDDDHTQYLLVDGTRSGSNLNIVGSVVADSFVGSGNNLTGLTESQITDLDKYTTTEVDNLLGSYSLTTHIHTSTDITDFDSAVYSNGSVAAATTHITSDGTDHTYIDQDVRTSASPTFVNGSFTGSITADIYFGYGGSLTGITATAAPGGNSGDIQFNDSSSMGGTGSLQWSGSSIDIKENASITLVGSPTKVWKIQPADTGDNLQIVSPSTATLIDMDGTSDGVTATNLKAVPKYNGAIPLTVTGASGQSVDLFVVENTTGSDLFKISSVGDITATGSLNGVNINEREIIVVCSDETTDLTAAGSVVTFRMPFAMTLTGVKASVTTAPGGSTIIVDINEAGTSVLSTKLTIDATEKTSTTAATPAVISDASIASDAEITIDIDQVGSTTAGTGLKVTLIGIRS